MEFYQRIKELRNEARLTQEQLGKEIGISKVSVWQWENNISYPRPEIAQKLCDYFNVSLDYLTGRTNIKKPLKEIAEDDFQVTFNNFQGELTEEDKQVILKMAQGFAASNQAKKKK